MGKHSSIREHHVGRIPPSVSSVWQAHCHHEALHGKHQTLGENGAHSRILPRAAAERESGTAARLQPGLPEGVEDRELAGCGGNGGSVLPHSH